MKIPPRLQLVLSLLAALSVLLALGAQSLTERFYKVGYYELLANWQHARTFTPVTPPYPAPSLPGCPVGLVNLALLPTMTSHCPLALDLNADSEISTAQTTRDGFARDFHFDFGGDLFLEETTWISAPDGLLARDINGNGRIDDGGELFSEHTRDANGQPYGFGFLALQALDSNADQRVDARDEAWAELRIWVDQNLDAIGSAEELTPLQTYGISAIDTQFNSLDTFYTPRRVGTPFASPVAQRDGSSINLVAVDLPADKANSRYWTYVSASDAAAQLPNFGGRGKIPSLAFAMTLDDTLRQRVDAFVQEQDPARWDALVEDIFLHWGQVEKDETIVFNNLRRYHLEMINKLYGVTYSGTASKVNEVAMLGSMYRFFLEQFHASLMKQSHLKPVFDLIPYTINARNAPEGELGPVQQQLDNVIASDRAAGIALLQQFHRALRGDRLASGHDYDAFRNHYLAQSDDIRWAFASAGFTEPVAAPRSFRFPWDQGQLLLARTGSATMRGTPDSDTILKLQRGHAAINAGDGNDVIEFHESERYLDRFTLEHYVFAGEGNNSLLLADAVNFIFAGDGADHVVVSQGITRMDLGNGNNTVVFAPARASRHESVGHSHVLRLGDGNDTVSITSNGDYDLSLGTGDDLLIIDGPNPLSPIFLTLPESAQAQGILASVRGTELTLAYANGSSRVTVRGYERNKFSQDWIQVRIGDNDPSPVTLEALLNTGTP